MKQLAWLVPILLGLFFPVSVSGEAPGIPYQTACQVPLHAVEKVAEETATFRRLRVEFDGIKGDRVPAFLYLPKVDKPLRAAVLLQYGSGGSKATDYIMEIGQQFVEHGFTVLTIDSPLRGERKSKDSKKPLLGLFSRALFAQYCGDYSRAIDYLASRKDVDRARIAYVGISWGAVTGVTFAAHDKRVKVVASLIGGGSFGGLLSAWSSTGSAKARPSLDPADNVRFIAPRPLLMLNVTKDQLIPRPNAEALHKAAGEGSQIRWVETDHYFSGVDRRKVIEGVIEFVQRELKGAESP